MPALTPFADFLSIPDVLHPDDGKLAVTAIETDVHLHSALPPTKVWCYRKKRSHAHLFGPAPSYIGPTIEVERGDRLTVEWVNEIPAASTLPYKVIEEDYVDGSLDIPQNKPGSGGAPSLLPNLKAALVTHLHGGSTQADFDGWPDNTILSGQTTRYLYHNDQRATLLWYHDHAMHVTRLNVYAGLAGAWLIRDDHEKSLDLPSGEHEIPLIIQDRNLDLDAAGNFTGAILHKTETGDGPGEFFGPYTLVNGTIWPKVDVRRTLYRFRVLNGSNARAYRLVLLNDKGENVNANVWQIGCDQGLMPDRTPLPPEGLVVSPGERVDLLIDFSAHSGSLYLWNTANSPFGNDPPMDPAVVKAEVLNLIAHPSATSDPSDPTNRRPYPQVMRFDVHGTGKGGRPVPQHPGEPLPALSFDAKIPVRVMLLVENPAKGMLNFWECLPGPVPPDRGTPPQFNVTYRNLATGAVETKLYWRAAKQFYDTINWMIHLDSTEQWCIVNLTPDTHPIHVHLVDFQVLRCVDCSWDQRPDPTSAPVSLDPGPDDSTGPVFIDGGTNIQEVSVEPNMRGPKDTVRVNPGQMITIGMKFSPFPGRFMYHCHTLEHEDHDMMRPIIVVPRWVPHHNE